MQRARRQWHCGDACLLGTNQFANPAEQALERIDSGALNAGHRGARRLMSSFGCAPSGTPPPAGTTPRVLLAEIGDAKMRAARSNFAANFFACAGFRDL